MFDNKAVSPTTSNSGERKPILEPLENIMEHILHFSHRIITTNTYSFTEKTKAKLVQTMGLNMAALQ